jgi:hypothetical protein
MSRSGAVKDGCHGVALFGGNGLSLQGEPCLNIGEHCRRHRILRCVVDSPAHLVSATLEVPPGRKADRKAGRNERIP